MEITNSPRHVSMPGIDEKSCSLLFRRGEEEERINGGGEFVEC